MEDTETRKFYKTLFTITVLSPDAPISPDADLEQIAYAINEGDCLGQLERHQPTEVPVEKIRAESRALGNDGGFFDHDDDLPDFLDEIKTATPGSGIAVATGKCPNCAKNCTLSSANKKGVTCRKCKLQFDLAGRLVGPLAKKGEKS